MKTDEAVPPLGKVDSRASGKTDEAVPLTNTNNYSHTPLTNTNICAIIPYMGGRGADTISCLEGLKRFDKSEVWYVRFANIKQNRPPKQNRPAKQERCSPLSERSDKVC